MREPKIERKPLWNAAEIQWHTNKAVIASGGKYAEFKELRPLISIPEILAWYGHYGQPTSMGGLEANGDELVGACMLGTHEHGKPTSFSMNAKSGSYQCFSCRKKGSIFHWVAQMLERAGCENATLATAGMCVQDIHNRSMKETPNLNHRTEEMLVGWGKYMYSNYYGMSSSSGGEEEAQTKKTRKKKRKSARLGNFLVGSVMTWREAQELIGKDPDLAENYVVLDLSDLRHSLSDANHEQDVVSGKAKESGLPSLRNNDR